MQADFGPGAYGFEGHAAVDQRFGELAAGGAEGVRADGKWAGGLVGFEESKGFGGREEGEEFCGEEGRIAVVGADILGELIEVGFSGTGRVGEGGEGGEDADDFGDARAEELEVGC